MKAEIGFADKMKVVICGGGIMGVATAYYLSLRGVGSTLIDCCGIAGAASGQAGAVLTRQKPGWDPKSPLAILAARGFDMHVELAKKFPDCGYRRISGMQTTVQQGCSPKPRDDKFDWLDGPVTGISLRDSPDGLLQVLPKKLTEALFSAAKTKGVTFVKGTIEDVSLNSDQNKVTGVTVDGRVIEADVVVIALGPWCKRAVPWLDIPVMETSRMHGVCFKPIGLTDTPYIFHLDVLMDLPEVVTWLPLIQHRSDDTIYVSGAYTREPLPESPADVHINQPVLSRMEGIAHNMCHKLVPEQVRSYHVGALADTPDENPLIGQLSGKKGCYLITGHHNLGILTAPSSCAALAKLIVTGCSSTLDLEPFDPNRFN